MKKLSLILSILLITFLIFYFFRNKDKKVIISYRYAKEGIEIEEYNKSNTDVFLFINTFRIYREKYNDTLYIGSLRNGKQEKWHSASETKNDITTIVCPPFSGKKVFEIDKVIGIDKRQKEEVRLALIKMDSIFNKHFSKMTKDYPLYYFIKPKNKVVIKYKRVDILEKGKYKLFFYKKGYVEDIKYNEVPKGFKLLDGDEIEDNPLEFEVK